MEYVVAFLVLIGVLIWFHELGHFLFAKLFGVKVEVFSIGFGPVLLKKQYGETEYRLSVIPLGGFVKLYGEEDNLADPRAFSSKPNWQKILIAFAGSFFNFILAILVFWFLGVLGKEVPKYALEKPVVGYVQENSLAERLGIREGDLVLSVNGKEVKTWKDLEERMLREIFARTITVEVLRGGKVEVLRGELDVRNPKAFGAEPIIEPVIGGVLEGSPAHQVGIRKGDRILSINGVEVKTWQEAVKLIRSSEKINLRIERDGREKELTILPMRDPKTNLSVIGVIPHIETVRLKQGVYESLVASVEKIVLLSGLTLKAVWSMITGALSPTNLGGPIAIAQLAGQSAQQGIIPYLNLLAFISVQLAIFNLLPLPMLDGGLIVLFFIEMLRRKPLSVKFKEAWQKTGLALIIALSLFVILNDLIRLFSGKKF
ncbi:RIP metalloprotease RseP [Thermocrinis jamiesonii]|jgi:RIP metalloprotease RseP|uniref:RIP metalloprotease RseP n=1 Tax=Thermocrinis jamiesonii TaxID=1302351 RepID=UPI0004952A28|nr:RIP metalloprotease RseP [Thermocrinis jamiesonii]